ncbi:MAG: alpha amylase C-terminal domain-containing protein, partial [Anaerolineales bacterium]
AKDPVHRKWDLDQLTFAMVYEYSERFVMPLSHDEVVHGKGSMLQKMPGDTWQKFANLRLLLTYQFTRPGKKLLFMGTELAPWQEWNHDVSLDWDLLADPAHARFSRFLTDLGQLYRRQPELWEQDHESAGFQWVVSDDRENSVVAYLRRAGDKHLVVLLNLTPVPREPYRIGVPATGSYEVVFSSDRGEYGGSDYEILDRVETEPIESHGRAQSIELKVPALGALLLASVS